MYVPYRQYPWLLPPDFLVVRTAASTPLALAQSVEREVHRLDASLPVTDVATMEQVAHGPIVEKRMITVLMVSFAGLALVLSAMGAYSVLSYSMAQRTREIGMRVALAAPRSSVVWMIMAGGVRLALAGIGIGTAAAFMLTRLMAGLLYGIRPNDPLNFVVVSGVMLGTALFASLLPARRALRIDPIEALRHQ